MARSSGYRATKENRAELAELRAELSRTPRYQWQKARYIMQQITSLTGHHMGPSGGSIVPRSCKFCKYFGHTQQHCPVRKAKEASDIEQALEAERAELERIRSRCISSSSG